MGRPPLDSIWRERTRIVAATSSVSQKEIVRRLERQATQEGRTDAPSLRTVRRYLHGFAGLSAAEHEQYAYFHWPESMESRALPWEASRAALDLLVQWQSAGRGRPLLAVVAAYLQVLQALPREWDLAHDADREPVRLQMAALLAAVRLTGGKSYAANLREIERSLALSGDAGGAGTELTIRIPNDVVPLFETLTSVPLT